MSRRYRAQRNVLTVMLAGVAIFVAICSALWWYASAVYQPQKTCLANPGAEWFPRTHVCRVTPANACESRGGWWDPQSGTCARVVYVPSITGKKR
jgi:hypothetical protein